MTTTPNLTSRTLLASAAAALLAIATPAAHAQTAPRQVPLAAALTGNPKQDTIIRLSRPITVELRDQRLQDVLTFISELTEADITPYYADTNNPEGLDPDQLISLNARDMTALTLLERVLAQATPAFGSPDSNTWQMSDTGSLEIGPKDRLNRNRRVELYDINDLLFIYPDFNDAPDFDLNSVLQSGGGGGGGQSPFQDNNDDSAFEDQRPPEERAQDIIDILITTVEIDQWTDNGGDAATIRYFQGALIVNAPDYIHRGINGYPWWPARHTTTRTTNTGRYVTLNTDTVSSRIDFADD